MIADFTWINLNVLFGTIEVCINTDNNITIDVAGSNYNFVVDKTSLIKTNDSEPYAIIYQIITLLNCCEHDHQIFGKFKHV